MSLHMELFAMLSVIIQHRCGMLLSLRVGLGSTGWMNILDEYSRYYTEIS